MLRVQFHLWCITFYYEATYQFNNTVSAGAVRSTPHPSTDHVPKPVPNTRFLTTKVKVIQRHFLDRLAHNLDTTPTMLVRFLRCTVLLFTYVYLLNLLNGRFSRSFLLKIL